MVHKKPLLYEAFEELGKLFPRIREMATLRDDYGKFALVVTVNGHLYVLCAKGSMDGEMVSFHASLISEAKHLKTKIALYLKKSKEGSKAFYIFLPADIESDSKKFLNERKSEVMVNCSIHAGTNLLNLMKVPALPQPGAQI